MSPVEQQVLRTARALLDLDYPLEDVLSNSLIPLNLRDFVRIELQKDENFTLIPARMLVADPNRPDWLNELDRSAWHYWPTLRQFLLNTKKWSKPMLRGLDDSSDKILRRLASPKTEQFDIRGLVLGFVQSGKTANYTAVIAKAADAGYRLVIVLSGSDKGLRLQTNLRLKRELVGYPDNRSTAVHLPPLGRQWHEFTSDEIDGDFEPGYANHGALQGSQPVLMVVKKNGSVLRKLLGWIDNAPPEIQRTLPFLLIDDEADYASIDVRGSHQTEDDDLPGLEYEPPSVINGLIRDLLQRFDRRCYIAYTATPFANILIPHDASDPDVGSDLYPKDFIVDLPKPHGYFGVEEFFGRMEDEHFGGIEGRGSSDFVLKGIDVIREVADRDIQTIINGEVPASLKNALEDFVLGGATRAQRGQSDLPATMLIHISERTFVHSQLNRLISDLFSELRDEWRYHRDIRIRKSLQDRWESEFRPITRSTHIDCDVTFDGIESYIGPFFEAVQVREINSITGDVLDYQREGSLKVIAIGGNSLSRGLTLEGLMVSFFIRTTENYDTLMQMGRWFGFHPGYEDLIRIHTTVRLKNWFIDLAFVEYQLREDIQIYESENLTPKQMGMRIRLHPAMQVTSRLKRRYETNIMIAQSYSLSLAQTHKFPLQRPRDLVALAEANLQAIRTFSAELGEGDKQFTDDKGPVWLGVSADKILDFLSEYQVDDQSSGISLPLIHAYINKLQDEGELVNWTVAVRGLETIDEELGTVDWGLTGGTVSQISRSRIGETDSIGVLTSPRDELVGLSREERQEADRLVQSPAESKINSLQAAARKVRHKTNGLLLLYPISRYSKASPSYPNRRPLFSNPNSSDACNLVGMALSFPKAEQAQHVIAYSVGSVGWRVE